MCNLHVGRHRQPPGFGGLQIIDVHPLSSETSAFHQLPDHLVETDKSRRIESPFVEDGFRCYVMSDVCRTAQPTRDTESSRYVHASRRYLWRFCGINGARLGEARFSGLTPLGWPPLELMCITPPLFTPSQSERGRANLANPANAYRDQTRAPEINPVALSRLIW